MRVGSSFEVYESGLLVFGGVIDEVSRDFPRQVQALGWARRAEDFEALSSGPTSNPRAAVSAAISRGLPWTGSSVFDNTNIGSTGDGVRRLDPLLTAWADKVGKRWGFDSSEERGVGKTW